MGMMSGKRVLIVGLASKLSIAYGIATAIYLSERKIARPR